jgi:hypothetical protein
MKLVNVMDRLYNGQSRCTLTTSQGRGFLHYTKQDDLLLTQPFVETG